MGVIRSVKKKKNHRKKTKKKGNASFLTTPKPITFEEVNLSVAAPHQCRIDVVRDAGKSLGNVLRVPVVHGRTRVLPVLRALEEVSLTVLVRERGVYVAGQAGPRAGDRFWKPLGEPVVGQLPVIIACRSANNTHTHRKRR